MADQVGLQQLERDRSLREALGRVDAMVPFGPAFFLTQLAAFVRDRCPDPAEGLPHVQIHLFGGELLDVCHVIGLGPSWTALAVFENDGTMRTELVPYGAIVRVTVRSGPEDGRVGFKQGREPVLPMSPEEALRTAATPGSAGRLW